MGVPPVGPMMRLPKYSFRVSYLAPKSYKLQKLVFWGRGEADFLISHVLKFIFIYIPKCAGTSVETALKHRILPHKVVGDGTNYVGVYDQETMREVGKLCAEENELFKYRFGYH